MKKDFSNFKFRCSALHKIMVGEIGLTEKQEEAKNSLLQRKLDASEGKAKELTDKMQETLSDLLKKEKNKELSKTTVSELRKIHRMETYNRRFNIMNKYLVKGIVQEEEAITLFQDYLLNQGTRVLFRKNEERLTNDWISGTPDLMPIMLDKTLVGFDTKASWNLESFPFEGDELPSVYFYQNMGYMWLTGAKEWKTTYCLVNIHEHGLYTEKAKFYYAYGCPDTPDDDYYDEYLTECKNLERDLIFDYDRFVARYPGHQIVHTREEWHDNGYDIPNGERVIEKSVQWDSKEIEKIKERITIARKCLNEL